MKLPELRIAMSGVPRTAAKDDRYFACPHGIDTRWWDDKPPCLQCCDRFERLIVHTWVYKLIIPQKRVPA